MILIGSLHSPISRKRLITADTCLIWDLFEAASQEAAVGLPTTRGSSLASFYRTIHTRGTVRGACLHPVDDAKWTSHSRGFAAKIRATNPVLVF
jgi:hypothetical protein